MCAGRHFGKNEVELAGKAEVRQAELLAVDRVRKAIVYSRRDLSASAAVTAEDRKRKQCCM